MIMPNDKTDNGCVTDNHKKQGISMKDFATALYEKVRSSPKTRFQRTWQEAQTWSQSNRTGCQEQLYVPFTSVGKTKPYKYAHHTLSGKKDYTTGKTTRLHSEKSKQ